MKLHALALCLFVCIGAFAQSVHNGNLQVLGSFDASTGLWSKPMTAISTDPTGACSNAAAMVINTSTGAQRGDISVCVNSNWQLANNTSLALTGDVVGTASGGSLAATVKQLNGIPLTNLNGLAKWTSGQPSSAVAADVVSLFGSGTCSGVLQGDGTCLGLSLPLSVANGGNGTAAPGLSAGANVAITGTWPNYTISAAGGGGGSGGASLSQFAPAYGSGTVTFGSCSSITPCFVAPNGIMDSFTATPVVAPASGSAGDTLWVYAVPGSNTVQVGYNSANTYSCTGCSLVAGVQSAPANSYGLFSCTVTSGQIISGGCAPASTPYSNSSIATGLGVSAVRDVTTGKITLNNDREVRKVTTGTTDILQPNDCGHDVVYAVSGTMAVTIPQAGLGTQFIAGCDVWLINTGINPVTFTPSGSSHFNGLTGSQTLAAAATAAAPTGVYLSSDGNDYSGIILGAGGGSGGGAFNGGTISNPLTISVSAPANTPIPFTVQNTAAGYNTLMYMVSDANTWKFQANGTASSNPGGFALLDGTGSALVANQGSHLVTISKGLAVGVNSINFSTAPTFDFSKGNFQTITLTGTVVSSTAINLTAGQTGFIQICQDATGGRTFVWPTNVHTPMTIGTTASKCSVQGFASFDGSNLYAIGAGVINQ